MAMAVRVAAGVRNDILIYRERGQNRFNLIPYKDTERKELCNVIDNYRLHILNSRGNASYIKTHYVLVLEILTHKAFIYMAKPLHISSYYPM